MLEDVIVDCPACGEAVAFEVDTSAGPEQSYYEDCPVCCSPNLISASWSAEDDGYHIQASPEI